MSSSTQKPRPWVAMTRSLSRGWIRAHQVHPECTVLVLFEADFQTQERSERGHDREAEARMLTPP